MSAKVISLDARRDTRKPKKPKSIHPPCETCGHGVVDHLLGSRLNGLSCDASGCACADYEVQP